VNHDQRKSAAGADMMAAVRTQADRMLLGVLAVHLMVCLGFAAFSGEWGAALAIGVPALVVPALLYRAQPGGLVSRLAIAFATMIFSALLIHQVKGQIEAHFGIFALLAFLLLYCDWKPLVAAAGLIAVHHLSFAYLQSGGAAVYVFPEPDGVMRVLVHALYVVLETGVLIFMSRVLRQMVHEGMTVSAFAGRVTQGYFDYPFAEAQVEHSPVLSGVSRMQADLASMLRGIKASADNLSQLAQRLSASAHDIAGRADEQNDSTEAMAAAVEEMTVSIAQITDNAANAHALSSSARAAATDGSQVVEGTVHEMSQIARVIQDAAASVELLGSKSERAAEVVVIIKEIADQTNLLALNAAIEAARAGELGRGFAVVADEVRKLAERTTQATNEIAQMMDDMRSAKESVLSDISSAVDRVHAGVEQASRAGTTYGSITEKAIQVGDVVAGISSAISEQNTATREFANHVEHLTRMAEKTSASTREISREAQDLQSTSARLHESMERFHL
jgi:methyl-accepting chemotaxis protein